MSEPKDTSETLTDNSQPADEQGPVSDNPNQEVEGALKNETAKVDLVNEDDDDLSDIEAVDPAAHDDVDLQEEEIIEEKEKGDPFGGHSYDHLKRVLEAGLFASGGTLSVSHLRQMFSRNERPHGKIVRQVMAELIESYKDRGLLLVEVASGYRFQTDPSTAQWVSKLWDEKPQKYSRALMETSA